MEFALNYSPQAAELLRAGKIEIDRFKCPPWRDMIVEARQFCKVYVHFDLVAGTPKLAKTDWDVVEALLAQTDTAFVNLHLAPRGGDMPEFDDPNHPACYDAVVEQLIRDVEMVVRRFGTERVIAENVPYRDSGGYFIRNAILPEAVSQVVTATGCGLLLDVSHARIAAFALGMDWRDYIAALPLDRVRELHLTGLGVNENVITDHLALTDADWLVVGWAMEQIRTRAWSRPALVALEYGGVSSKFEWRTDSTVIATQVPRLLGMVRELG